MVAQEKGLAKEPHLIRRHKPPAPLSHQLHSHLLRVRPMLPGPPHQDSLASQGRQGGQHSRGHHGSQRLETWGAGFHRKCASCPAALEAGKGPALGAGEGVPWGTPPLTSGEEPWSAHPERANSHGSRGAAGGGLSCMSRRWWGGGREQAWKGLWGGKLPARWAEGRSLGSSAWGPNPRTFRSYQT